MPNPNLPHTTQPTHDGSPQATPNLEGNPSPIAIPVEATIHRLRAEYEANSSTTHQAILLHEIGLLEEATGDEAAAARDQLQAVNAEAEFREPLERLIAIIQRRKSFKNLGKLLDRLLQVTEAPGERARALLENAAFLADHADDLAAARDLLFEAVELTPEDEGLWLQLEWLGWASDDLALVCQALERRAHLTKEIHWRGLLLLDLAEAQYTQGNIDDAIEAVEAAVALKGPATFKALLALEQYAARCERADLTARALDAQASLILAGVENKETLSALGIPSHRATPASAADAWIRAAKAKQQAGDLDAAQQLLARAKSHVPDDPVLIHTQLQFAEIQGNTALAASLAKQELDLGVGGSVAASLWLRVAEAATAEGNGEAALEAVTHALKEDPSSVPARVLELDLLIGGANPPALASALEAVSSDAPTDAAKARYFIAAADAWARLAGDSQGAKAALSQAGMFGTPPSTIARLARMLAAITDDGLWYEDATRRLLASGAPEAEQLSLWFELGRNKLLRGDIAGASVAFRTLETIPGGNWLGPALSAYVLPLVKSEEQIDTSQALETLLASETNPDEKRALKIVSSIRARLAGDPERARSVLAELHQESAGDVLVGLALVGLQREAGDTVAARQTLSSLALAVDNSPTSAALHAESGLIAWAAGDRESALESFALAARANPGATSTLLEWALKAAGSRHADNYSTEINASPEPRGAYQALEAWSLRLQQKESLDSALEALEDAPEDRAPDLAQAIDLARGLSLTETSDAEPNAWQSLAARDAAWQTAYRASAYQQALEQAHQLSGAAAGAPNHLSSAELAKLEGLAASWAASDRQNPESALEWLAQASALSNVDHEIQALRQLAGTFPGESRASVLASASLIAQLTGQENPERYLSHGAGKASRLALLELALPGSDPRRRARALTGIEGSLGDEAPPLAHCLAGFNHLAAGQYAEAELVFRSVTEALPSEVIGWEGLRATAQASGDRNLMAEACAALGDAVADPAKGAELWERAALILIDELNDNERGELALVRSVERDIGRDAAFDRLFRMVRARKDPGALLDLIERRLGVAEDPDEIAKLFWERARVLRKQGDLDGALAALENVTMLEAEHVGALALMGEIALSTQRFEEAAEYLARLAALSEAPVKQRLMSAVAAADIYENKLNNVPAALQVLVALHEAGLSTLPIRERLVRAAGKAGAWDQATQVLESLMLERDTSSGRVEAARLALVIHRDRRKQPAAAASALKTLLKEAPADGEALDFLLSGQVPEALERELVGPARHTLVSRLRDNPLDADEVGRLARVAQLMEDAPLRQATLGALTALGKGSAEIDAELQTLDQRVARTPQMAIVPEAFPELLDEEDQGVLVSLMPVLAPVFLEAIGPGLAAIGVGKRDRVDPRSGLPVRNELAAWAGALGVGDFELYVGGSDAHGITAIPAEKATFVVGTQVQAPFDSFTRALAAREMYGLKRGTNLLRHREPNDIAALLVATCRVLGVPIEAPAYALLPEFERLLNKAMPRKLKKSLPPYLSAFVQSGQDAAAWVTTANGTLDRMAAIAAGDVSVVAQLIEGAPRGATPQTQHGSKRLERLLGFVLSPAYLDLRARLGMGVR